MQVRATIRRWVSLTMPAGEHLGHVIFQHPRQAKVGDLQPPGSPSLVIMQDKAVLE